MSAAQVGDLVRTGTGLVRVVTKVYRDLHTGRTAYGLMPPARERRGFRLPRTHRAYADNVTLVRTYDLVRVGDLMALANARAERDDVPGARQALNLASARLDAARSRAADPADDIATAARALSLCIAALSRMES